MDAVKCYGLPLRQLDGFTHDYPPSSPAFRVLAAMRAGFVLLKALASFKGLTPTRPAVIAVAGIL